MWKKIERDDYIDKIRKQDLNPIGGMTDLYGTQPNSNGVPKIVTVWGTDNIEKVKLVRTGDPNDEEEWDYRYYEKI